MWSCLEQGQNYWQPKHLVTITYFSCVIRSYKTTVNIAIGTWIWQYVLIESWHCMHLRLMADQTILGKTFWIGLVHLLWLFAPIWTISLDRNNKIWGESFPEWYELGVTNVFQIIKCIPPNFVMGAFGLCLEQFWRHNIIRWWLRDYSHDNYVLCADLCTGIMALKEKSYS